MNVRDWADIVADPGSQQYQNRIDFLRQEGKETRCIEDTIKETIENLNRKDARSFVIFGEPQSGKTEMMIALNAKLLDEGHRVIVNLLTDSVDLLDQSLSRFQNSGLNPSPKKFDDLPDQPKKLKGQKWVIFCKKNAGDMRKLIKCLRGIESSDVIVIDDEADYASPDRNVNKQNVDPTKINGLISKLLGEYGRYIGVTATPARLNLNNTFRNKSERWVEFKPHPSYVGQDFFFPENRECKYCLRTFKMDRGNDKSEIEKAILHFLCGVAELHIKGKKRENFTMLIHTSGRKEDHREDVKLIKSTLNALSDKNNIRKFEKMCKKLLKIAEEYSENDCPNETVKFVLRNIRREEVVEINSNQKRSQMARIAKPTNLFSFGVGGNIVSRGVTFENLLSMYFTRSVKGKFSQDTYIQRARMFGAREEYKKYFQLWIPDVLMGKWSTCFALHRLALEALRSGAGVPVWISDDSSIPTAIGSIDKSSVDFQGGEMSFALFDYDETVITPLFERGERSDQEILAGLKEHFSETVFPRYVFEFLKRMSTTRRCISFHRPSGFGTRGSRYADEEKKNIRRSKGIFATNEYARSEFPDARHHLKVFHNEQGQARLFYKINGGKIKFIQNRGR